MIAQIFKSAVVRKRLAAMLICLSFGASSPVLPRPRESGAEAIRLAVDARDVLRGVQHAHILMPARPGPMVLAYPKWIPGEHRPNGPITQLVNLRISANGRALEWRRDPLDAFAFSIDVPEAAGELDIQFDYLSPAASFAPGYGNSPNVTPDLAFILFNHLLLYPADARADEVRVSTRLRLPEHWEAASALPISCGEDGRLTLPETTLAALVDAPVMTGKSLLRRKLAGTGFPARLAIAADAGADADPGPDIPPALARLTNEIEALVGGGMPGNYAWLVAIGDTLRHDGLEHHNSSDVRVAPGFFSDPHDRYLYTLLSHELFHAWNGKFRIPAGMATSNFQQPVNDQLLWVYEGLTRYYGDIVLPTRSGLVSAEQTHAYVAYIAAQAANGRPGRNWRSLGDTATANPGFAHAPMEGTAARRGSDYYNEMMLIWLEADMRIRRYSNGRRSLDDFCKRFLARGPGDAAKRPYTREDLIDALDEVAPLDWGTFVRERVDRLAPAPPLDGLAAAGWKLDYSDVPTAFWTDVEQGSGIYNFSDSLGLWVTDEGLVRDVVPDSPAYDAALVPGMTITAIGSHPWMIEALRAAIAQRGSGTLHLAAVHGARAIAIDIAYRGGLRFPRLRRIEGSADTLAVILAPLASAK